MLLLKNLRAQSIRIVIVEHRDDFLKDDGAAIKLNGYQVHGNAGVFHPVLPCLILSVHPRKRGQQRRVNIQNSVWKRLDKDRAKQSHKPSQADQLNIPRLQLLTHEFAVIFFARWKPRLVQMVENDDVQACLTCSVNSNGIGPI